MLSRAEKETIVNQLKDDLSKSQAVFVTNLIGVSANDAVRIRKSVRDVKGKIIITKNTLYRRATAGTKCEEIFRNLKGPNAIAFAFEDAAAVAKTIHDAGKELDAVKLTAGVLDGKVLSTSQLIQLANLPSRDQMLGTLLATFNAPISAFARVLNAIKEKKEVGTTLVDAVTE